MAKRKRRAFATEFKAQAVRIVRESGKSVRGAPRLSASQDVRIELGARARVHCSNSVGDTLPRALCGRTAL